MESCKVPSEQIMQYPGGLRTAVIRMTLSGIAPQEISFDPPDSPEIEINPQQQIFHRSGGGAKYVRSVSDFYNSSVCKDSVGPYNKGLKWAFNWNHNLKVKGTDEADLIAILPDVTYSICNEIAQKAGYAGLPKPQTFWQKLKKEPVEYDYIPAIDAIPYLDRSKASKIIPLANDGKIVGCYRAPDNLYYFVGLIFEQ